MPLSRGIPQQNSDVLIKDRNNLVYYWYRWFQDLFTFIDTKTPEIYTDNTAPTSTPRKVGDMFVDTSANKVYVATGTSSSSDWTILN